MAENAKYKKQKQFDILEINSTNHLHILKIHLIGYKTVASKSNLDTKRWKNKNIFPSSQISASMLLATKRKSDFAPCACANVGGSGTTMYRVFSFHGHFVLQGRSLNFWSGNREKANNRKYGIVCDTVNIGLLVLSKKKIFKVFCYL